MSKKPFKGSDGPVIILIALAALLVAQIIIAIPLSFAKAAGGAVYEIVNYAGMILLQLVFMGVYLLYTKKRNIVSAFSPRNKVSVWAIVAPLAITIICFTCFLGPAYYFENLLLSSGYNSSSDMTCDGAVSIVLMVVATVIAAPICEETIFRSALLSGLIKVRKDDMGMAVICGACFALMHLNPEQTVYQFCLGCTSAYLALKCRSVIPSIILHSLSNVFAVVVSFTSVGAAFDAFYGKAGVDIPITLITCILMPAIACVLIWVICRYLRRHEEKKYPDKFRAKRVIWIDEKTLEPIYEGGQTPVITDGNRMVQDGFSAFTGAPVMVDRLERQATLMEQFHENSDEKSGVLGKKTYGRAFMIYFALTAVFWLATLAAGYLMTGGTL